MLSLLNSKQLNCRMGRRGEGQGDLIGYLIATELQAECMADLQGVEPAATSNGPDHCPLAHPWGASHQHRGTAMGPA